MDGANTLGDGPGMFSLIPCHEGFVCNSANTASNVFRSSGIAAQITRAMPAKSLREDQDCQTGQAKIPFL